MIELFTGWKTIFLVDIFCLSLVLSVASDRSPGNECHEFVSSNAVRKRKSIPVCYLPKGLGNLGLPF